MPKLVLKCVYNTNMLFIKVILAYDGGDLGHDALPVLMCACTLKYILTMVWFSLGDLLRLLRQCFQF